MTVERMARLTAAGVALLGGLLLIGAGWIPNIHPDADAYWQAALRIRDGLPLYGGSRLDETQIYRYAPWFAYAWLPLTLCAVVAVVRGAAILHSEPAASGAEIQATREQSGAAVATVDGDDGRQDNAPS